MENRIPENQCDGCANRDRMIETLSLRIDDLEGRKPKTEDENARSTDTADAAKALAGKA